MFNRLFLLARVVAAIVLFSLLLACDERSLDTINVELMDLKIGEVTSETLVLEWMPQESIENYIIYLKLETENTFDEIAIDNSSLAPGSTGTVSYRIENLLPQTFYIVQFAVVTQKGEISSPIIPSGSLIDTEGKVCTLPLQKPYFAEEATIDKDNTEKELGKLKIQWPPAIPGKMADGSEAPFHYEVKYRKAAEAQSGSWIFYEGAIDAQPPGLTATLSQLEGAADYDIQVEAVYKDDNVDLRSTLETSQPLTSNGIKHLFLIKGGVEAPSTLELLQGDDLVLGVDILAINVSPGVTWTTNVPDLVDIQQSDGNVVTITGIHAGSVTISATSESDITKKDTIGITVTLPPEISGALSYHTDTSAVYGHQQSYPPSLSGLPEGLTSSDLTYAITAVRSSSAAADLLSFDIDAHGIISTAIDVLPGTYGIDVTASHTQYRGELTAVVSITVNKAPFDSFVFNYNDLLVAKQGEETKFPLHFSVNIPANVQVVYSITGPAGISIDTEGAILVSSAVPSGDNQITVTVSVSPEGDPLYIGSKSIERTLYVRPSDRGLNLEYKQEMGPEAQQYFSTGDIDNPFLFVLPGLIVKEGLSARIVIYAVSSQAIFYDSEDADIITEQNNVVGIGPQVSYDSDWINMLADNSKVRIAVQLEGSISEILLVEKDLAEKEDIYTWRDLQAIRHALKGNYFLRTDISFPSPGTYGFPDTGFEPLGRSWGSRYIGDMYEPPFTGSLTGTNGSNDNYTIRNLYIKDSGLSYGGLFGRIRGSGSQRVVVKDITFVDPSIEVSFFAGVLVGWLERGVVTGVHVDITDTSTTTVKTLYADSGNVPSAVSGITGGVAGYVDVEASLYASSEANVHALASNGGESKATVGGLVGSSRGTVVGYTVGNVRGEKDYVGGLVGYQNGGRIIGYATGDVIGTVYVGGLTGVSNGLVSGYSTGEVIGTKYVGGLVGKVKSQVTGYTRATVTRSRGYNTQFGALFGEVYFGDDLWGKWIHSYFDGLSVNDEYASGKELGAIGTIDLTGDLPLGNYAAEVSAEANIKQMILTAPPLTIYYDDLGTAEPSDDKILFPDTHWTVHSTVGQDGSLGEWVWVGEGKWPHLWDTADKQYFGDQPH